MTMTTFTDADAMTEKKLAALLAQAYADGEARIKRTDGKEFVLRPASRSPLDVGCINVQPPLTVEEIVQAVREGRERG
jgi:hypothetical protein